MGRRKPSPGYLPYLNEDAFNFFGPLGLPISPDLLCWWALEVHVYVGMPTSAHLRQTRQAVDLGQSVTLTIPGLINMFRYNRLFQVRTTTGHFQNLAKGPCM